MGEYRDQPDFLRTIRDLQKRVQALANTQRIRTYTVATRPVATTPQVIFVSDATAGQRYQGWDTTSSSWVPLG